MASRQVFCPACGTQMVSDDILRRNFQWIEVFICPRCSRKVEQVQEDEPPPPAPDPVLDAPPQPQMQPAPVRQDAPQASASYPPVPAAPPLPPPVAASQGATDATSSGGEEIPDVTVLLDRAMYMIAAELLMSDRAEVLSLLCSQSQWKRWGKESDLIPEFPLAWAD